MKTTINRKLTLKFGIALCGTLLSVYAGPPLICHPYDIGVEQSLPWGTGSGYNDPDRNYSTAQLEGDTLRILDRNPRVLVRMETMRRAALYGVNDHVAARSLLSRLRSRTTGVKPAAMALFDYGYFTESLKQLGYLYKEEMTTVDGYPFVLQAIALEPDAAEMHFAAAIMARDPRRADYTEHVRKARAATSDAMLAANVSSHLD